MIPGSMML